MTDLVTLLDAAHAAVSADPENEALRLRFFERLADGEMIVLLEREAVGDRLEPRVFALEDGPVVPWQPPRRLAQMTKQRVVSSGLPGPIRLSHQPGRRSPGCQPAACASPVRAWQTMTALSAAGESVP